MELITLVQKRGNCGESSINLRWNKFLINSYDVYRAIALLTSKNWILREEQAKKGIDDKVSNLYYRQHIEPYE